MLTESLYKFFIPRKYFEPQKTFAHAKSVVHGGLIAILAAPSFALIYYLLGDTKDA